MTFILIIQEIKLKILTNNDVSIEKISRTSCLTSMASIESDDSDHICEAALVLSRAVKAEANHLLLADCKDDNNEERKFIAKSKIIKYLVRADDINEKFLKNPNRNVSWPSLGNVQLTIDVGGNADVNTKSYYLERPWNHVAKYKKPQFVMKGIEKPSSKSKTQSILVPKHKRYMVDLVAFFKNEQKVILLLKAAQGGRWLNYIYNYKSTPKAKKSEGNSSATKDSGASSGGSESRASTPSREISSALAAPAPTSGSRGNRSKQAITCTDILAKKEDSKTEDSAKEDKDESSNKKKRGGSNQNISDKPNSSVINPNPNPVAGTNISSTISSAMPSTASTNNRLDSCVESEESFLSKIEVKIKMPDELKQCLADDWDAITRQHKLLDLPAKNTVQDIVDQYVAFKKLAKSTSASKELAITDVLNGVIEYFNVMLGSQLLYKFERPQYADILQQHPETPLSKLYGAFHLLRLFVKLGSMLGYSALDEKSMQMLLAHLHDFLKFLVKNSAIYFSMSNFVNVSPEYHRHTQ
uniref:MRG domain-containing protein n=1 Tax=Glossina palpalis gambiensis TaxID=67801 RepID=A0A1B0BWR7_9MUSC